MFKVLDVLVLASLSCSCPCRRCYCSCLHVVLAAVTHVLAVVVVEPSEGVVGEGQDAEMGTTCLHLELAHLSKKELQTYLLNSSICTMKDPDQVVKVHPLQEGGVQVLQVLVHCLPLDLLHHRDRL